MKDAGIEVSFFIDPELKQVAASARVGCQFIELHTGAYAVRFSQKAARNLELERLVQSAKAAHQLGVRVNAGHGLNSANVPLLHVVPHLVELNIGHHLVSRSIEVGLQEAIREMLAVMVGYSSPL